MCVGVVGVSVCILLLISKHVLMQILRLQECLSKYERSSDGSTPQVIVILAKLIFFYLWNYVTIRYDLMKDA
jgi:hypothetical protein